MNAKAIGTLVVLSAAIGAALWLKTAIERRRPKGTDVQQIGRMLFHSESAAERREPGGVNRYISASYRDGLGMTDAAIKYRIREYLLAQRSLDVEIPSDGILIQIGPDGKSASVRFPVTLASQPGTSGSRHEISLTLAKERVYYYWFFPGEEWRVTSAGGYGGIEMP